MTHINIEKAYIKLIDMSKYRATHEYITTGLPWMAFKPIVCLTYLKTNGAIWSELDAELFDELSRTFDYKKYNYIQQEQFDIIKDIWGTPKNAIMYVKYSDLTIQKMARDKIKLFEDQELDIKIIEPKPIYCEAKIKVELGEKGGANLADLLRETKIEIVRAQGLAYYGKKSMNL